MAVWASVVFSVASLSLAAGTWQNVALRKPAWVSKVYTGDNLPASKAVDGVTTANSFSYSAHTEANERTAWWKVDLQKEVQSAQVTIYFRTDYKIRRNGVQLYTSATNSSDPKEGSLCHAVTGRPDGTDIPDILNVTCLGTWRYLTVYTETDNDKAGAVLDFVEVQVWTCTSGYYGSNCDQSCAALHCKTDSSCDIQGQCVGGCAAGYQGTDCIQACGSGMFGEGCSKSCSNRRCKTPTDTCNHVTGLCPDGCASGSMGDDCLQSCNFGGTYGPNCASDCSSRHCKTRPSTCDIYTGQCTAGCEDGWTETDCTKACDHGSYGEGCSKSCRSRHCKTPSDTCNHTTGVCSDGCESGYKGKDCMQPCDPGSYGEGCSKSCRSRHCKTPSDACNHTTGVCSDGCESGYKGEDCMKTCTSGMYGPNCASECSSRHCKTRPSSCDRETGRCPDGCEDGWTEIDCTRNCADGFYGNNCSLKCADRHCTSKTCLGDGECSTGCDVGWTLQDCTQECSNGSYGRNCESTCGHCSDTNTCHHVSGTCPGGCQAGWELPLCQTECDNGTYGENCERDCGHCNGTCDAVDGRCRWGCTEGYNGSHCSVKLAALNGQDTSQLFPVSAVAGTVAGLLVAVILIVIVVLVIRKRRRYQGDINKHVAEFHPTAQENGAVGNVVLDENKAVHQKPPIQPKPATHAASSKQLSSKDKDQEEEDVDEEVPSPDSCYYNADAEDTIRDVVVPELAATVAMLKQRKDGFEREYNRLPTGFTASYQDSQKPENSGKNKFRGYYPYDHNRVRLTLLPALPGSDYINASLMHSFNQRKTYIAAQAPNKKTVGDFWRMIWEHSCSAVVMLTGLVEETKVKCEQYWPADGVMDVGLFTVEVEVTQIRANFTMRHMKVASKATGESRTVIQFHFTSWPDHGVPDTLALVSYIWLVRQTVEGTNGPLLVHCSAGIGRTGTYIAVDSLIDQAREEGVVDVLGFVSVMRGQRKNMIQTAAQYECVFHCLVEMTTYGSTSMDVSNYTTSYGSRGMDTTVDGRTHRQLSQMLVSETRDDAPNRHRMWVDGNPDFIVRVGPTLTCLRGYLQAAAPAPRLVKLLWKLVEENNVHNIIVVTPNPDLVEAEGKSKTHGGITVTTTSQTNLSGDLSMINLQLATKAGRPRQVKMVNADAHLTIEAMTSHLLNHADLQNTSTQAHPVVVVHSNNDRKLAVSLCIMGNILSGIREDARVDVVDHVRTFLQCSPDLQFTQSDVHMFHDFAQQCILRTDPANTYANI
ncbi:uncharacterized protein [Haliotis cracherodii]|uniref:uncharacterized protein n=1 Tax=Haliotis cracherodii TaxID=6455 RepID=UPI0039ED0A64